MVGGLKQNYCKINSSCFEVGVVCFIPEVIPYFSGGWLGGWVAGDVKNSTLVEVEVGVELGNINSYLF